MIPRYIKWSLKLKEKDVILSRIIRGMPGWCVGGAKEREKERDRDRGRERDSERERIW